MEQQNTPAETGENLPEVRVKWSTAFSESIWDVLANAGENHQGHIDIGPVLHYPRPGYLAYFVAYRQPKTETRSIKYDLHFRRKPKSDPPDWALEADRKAGHGAGIDSIISAIRDINPSAPAEYVVSSKIARTMRQCVLVPRPVLSTDRISALDTNATLEQVGFRFQGPLGLSEVAIVYLHLTDKYSITIVSNGLLEPTDASLDYVQKLLGIVFDLFF